MPASVFCVIKAEAKMEIEENVFLIFSNQKFFLFSEPATIVSKYVIDEGTVCWWCHTNKLSHVLWGSSSFSRLLAPKWNISPTLSFLASFDISIKSPFEESFSLVYRDWRREVSHFINLHDFLKAWVTRAQKVIKNVIYVWVVVAVLFSLGRHYKWFTDHHYNDSSTERFRI